MLRNILNGVFDVLANILNIITFYSSVFSFQLLAILLTNPIFIHICS